MDPFDVALVEDVIDGWDHWVLNFGIERPLVAKSRLNLEILAPEDIQKNFVFNCLKSINWYICSEFLGL